MTYCGNAWRDKGNRTKIGYADPQQIWCNYKPRWMREYFDINNSESAVEYWFGMRPLYPNLAQLALNVMLQSSLELK